MSPIPGMIVGIVVGIRVVYKIHENVVVSCITIHMRWALKDTRYIHEVGGFFNSMEQNEQTAKPA